ncbi:MAG: enoyl-CoA hydratase [Chloroflexi bacterium]|nr:enoyl-CoA hydratase [Chloroflexota bacterium]
MATKSVSTDPSTVTVAYETVGSIAILTLAEARRRNVLSRATMTALKGHLDRIAGDTSISVAIIRAEGSVFSSGHDLKELRDSTETEAAAIFALCSSMMEAIRLLPQPVIAQVQGLATAAGCQLAATCDLVVASENAAFATPGVKTGLFCTTPGVALARAVPLKKAMEMLLTGEPISAQEAKDYGLVNRIVSAEKLEEETMALARKVDEASSTVLRIGKQAFYRQIALDRPDAYQIAGQVMCENLFEPDAKEGISAFLEKREPKWGK